MSHHVTIITGAGSGIGRAVAIMLAKAGHNLTLVGRRRKPLEETATMLGGGGGEALIVAVDVGDAGAPAAIVDQTLARFGSVNVLVNNAGYAPLRTIDETDPAVMDETFRINAIAPANLIARVWPVFQRQGGGRIVNVSSMATVDPFPGLFAYAAAKASVELMVKSCAKEGRAHNVRAFAVAPGAVETGMLRANFPPSVLPARLCLTPEQVATVIVECVTGERDGDNGRTIYVPSPG